MNKKVMKAKHEFYLARDGKDAGRIKRMTAWEKWKGKAGDCGDGNVLKVNWKVPEIVLQACKVMEDAK